MPCAPQNIRRSSRYLKALRKLEQRATDACRRLASQLEVGAWGERAASHYLSHNGLILIKRNWRAGRLEADIIAVEGNTIVVAEVKTRHVRFAQNHPAISAITAEKYLHLERLGSSFVHNNGPLCRRYRLQSVRIDAVEVYYDKPPWGLRRVAQLTWHRGLERPCLRPAELHARGRS